MPSLCDYLRILPCCVHLLVPLTSSHLHHVIMHELRLDPLCRNLPFGGRAMRDSWVRLPRKENARSRHQCLFEENVGKIGKDMVYEL